MALPQAGVALVAEGLSGFVSDMGKANQAVVGFGDAGSKAGTTFKSGFGEIVTGALRHVGEIAVDALGKAAQATGAFLKDSIGLAGDFQSGMQEFQAVAGKDVDTKGLDQFHDLFLTLGKELPVSTSDVQQAAIEMVKGGIDPATLAAGGLKQNIQFAAAAMKGDLVGAAEISSKIVGGWADVGATAAEKADLLAHSTDLLTKAANASTVDVHDLSLGLFNVQGNAKLAGISLDDTTTVLAELAPNFSSAATAGTSLNAFIARLQPSTKPAIAAMRGLGLYTDEAGSAFYDSQGKFVGWAKVSQLLQDATNGLTDAQKQSTLQTIFGMDAMGTAAELTRQGADGYNAMVAALEKANGVQANVALKQQGYDTALKNAKGSVEALQITLGEKLLPILTTFLNDYIAPGINYVTSLAESFFKVYDATGSLVTAIDSIIPGFQSFYDSVVTTVDYISTNFVPPIQTAIGFISENLMPILAGVSAILLYTVVPAIYAWATASGVAAATTIAALAPVIAPIAAIGLAVGLLYKAWESDFGGIRTTVTQWWNDTLQPAFAQAADWLGKYLPVAIGAAKLFFTTYLIPALQAVWSFLTTYIFPAFTTAYNWLATTIPAAVQTTSNFWNNTLLPAFRAVSDFLTTYIFPFFQALANVHMAIVNKTAEAMAGIWQKTLLPAFTAVYDFLSTLLSPFLTAFADDVIKKVEDTTGGVWYMWQNMLLPALRVVWGFLQGKIQDILKDFSKWLGTVQGAIGSVGSAIQGVIGWLSQLASKIASIKLPDWMTPGSPTPWEIGLRGVGKALQTEVNPQIKALFNTLMVNPPASAQQILGVGAAGSTTINNSRTINMPVTTNMTQSAIGQSLAIAGALMP